VVRAKQLAGDVAALVSLYQDAIRLANGEADQQAAAAAKILEGKVQMDHIRADVQAFMATEQKLDDERQVTLADSQLLFSRLVVIGIGLSLALTGVATYGFSRRIGRRLKSLQDNVLRLAEGQELTAPLGGSDEMTRLDAAFHSMAQQLTASRQALWTAVEELRDLYNHAPCGYHSVDADGTIVAINDTELRWLGYTREEVVGKIRIPQLLTPESRRTFERVFPRLKKEGLWRTWSSEWFARTVRAFRLS
jgi:PAS domain-containing protein